MTVSFRFLLLVVFFSSFFDSGHFEPSVGPISLHIRETSKKMNLLYGFFRGLHSPIQGLNLVSKPENSRGGVLNHHFVHMYQDRTVIELS